MHILLEDNLVAEIDRRVGRKRRNSFIAESVQWALEDRLRWDEVEASLGTIADHGHNWDEDPAAWVRKQRSLGRRHLG